MIDDFIKMMVDAKASWNIELGICIATQLQSTI